MQSFVEWENYQLKKSQNWTKLNPISIKKSGVISFFVILVAGFHVYALFSVTDDSKTPTYHLCKVFYRFKIRLPNSFKFINNTVTFGYNNLGYNKLD